MEVTYTDGRWRDVGVIRDMKFDADFGDESNTFELALPARGKTRIELGALIYVEGTEYGGRYTKPGVRTKDGELIYGGPTWHGLLNQRRLSPGNGQDYLTFSGEANSVIADILSHIDTGGLFQASEVDTGVMIPQTQVRYATAWMFLRSVLGQVGMRPCLSYKTDHVEVSAVPSLTYDASSMSVEMHDEKVPVNHLICLGKGNLKDRTRIDLYADRDGRISTTQTIFGIDYNGDTYDYPNAEYEELLKAGIEKLSDMQESSEMDISLDYAAMDDSYSIGDKLYDMDDETGVYTTITIGQKTVTLGSGSVPVVSYTPGNGSEESAIS